MKKYQKLYNKSLMKINGGKRKHPYVDCGLGIVSGGLFGSITGNPIGAVAGGFLGAEKSCYTDVQ